MVYDGYAVRGIQTEVIDGIRVVRAPLYPNHSTSAVRRIANYFSYAASATATGLAKMKRPNVIFVYHPPADGTIPAMVLSALWRVPFVYRFRICGLRRSARRV